MSLPGSEGLQSATSFIHQTIIPITEAETVREIAARVAAAVLQRVDGEYALAALTHAVELGPDGSFDDELVMAAAPEDAKAERLRALVPWLLRAVSQRRTPVFFPTPTLPALLPVDKSFVTNLLLVPVLDGTHLLGVLGVLNRDDDPESTQFAREWLMLLATYTAVTCRKTRLLQTHRQHSRQLQERNRQLAAFSRAVRSIAGELSLDKVLQQIVDAARELIQAEYAALGVPNNDGLLETFVHSGMSSKQVAAMPHLPLGHGLLGAIVQEKRPIRIPRIDADPRSVGFPENHPKMESFLGVPIVGAGDTLGNLYLTNKIRASEFSQDDQKLAELLAAHAAVAIQNARLYEQVGRLIIVEERNRIGMDLHDGVIQAIYAVGLTLESTRLSMHGGNVEEADRLLGYAIEGLNNTIRDIRNFILDLRPHRFKGNLQEGLARLVREFQVNAMVEVDLQADAEAMTKVSTPVARALFLTTQEALANVARHARASHATVTIRRVGTAVELEIRDDGKGFDVGARSQAAVGHGLSNMRVRAEELDGSFSLESKPGQGTQIRVTIPQ